MNSVINLNKPKGYTSQDAVTKVKRALRCRKAGHAGTLDPIATGVLLVCTGEATKITGFLQELPKRYKAVFKLGETTDTYDSEGKITASVQGFSITSEEVLRALDGFRGRIEQVPPMYSALKKDGRPLYELARQGIEIERKGRVVNIYELELLSYNPPFVEIDVACSKGTYIRSLAFDIGNVLGVGAHITALERTRIGDFKVEDAFDIESLNPDSFTESNIDSSLTHLREITLDGKEHFVIKNGGRILSMTAENDESEYVRLKDPDGRLFAIGIVAGGRLKAERILHI